MTTLGPDCAKYDTPYTTGSTPDLSAKFTFVAPNLCNDAHDCSTATADRWLASEMPLFMHTPQYKSGNTVIFVTFDEGSSNVSQGPTSPPNNRIPMIVVSPRSSGRDGTQWTHYSLWQRPSRSSGSPSSAARRPRRPCAGTSASLADLGWATRWHCVSLTERSNLRRLGLARPTLCARPDARYRVISTLSRQDRCLPS